MNISTLYERLCTHKVFIKDQRFNLSYTSSPLNHMLWMCIRAEAILIHIHNILFYGEIRKIITFYHFDTNPRFTPFLLYVRCKSGVTFLLRCFRDVHFFAQICTFAVYCILACYRNVFFATYYDLCFCFFSDAAHGRLELYNFTN